MGSGTNFEQFKASLGNSYARKQLGFEFNQAEANWILADDRIVRAYFDRWLASPPKASPGHAAPERRAPTPARQVAPHVASVASDFRSTSDSISGFVLSVIGLLFVAVPILCLPLAIPGIVLSAKAKNRSPVDVKGRGLAVAGLTIGIVATSLTTLLMVLAFRGAWLHNFG